MIGWREPSGWEDRHTLDSGRVLVALRALQDREGHYPFIRPRGPRPPRRRRWLDALGVGMALVMLGLTDLMTAGRS